MRARARLSLGALVLTSLIQGDICTATVEQNACSRGLAQLKQGANEEALTSLQVCVDDPEITEDRKVLAHYLRTVAYFNLKNYRGARYEADHYLIYLSEKAKRLLTPEMLNFINVVLNEIEAQYPSVGVFTELEDKASPYGWRPAPIWVLRPEADPDAVERPLPPTFQ